MARTTSSTRASNSEPDAMIRKPTGACTPSTYTLLRATEPARLAPACDPRGAHLGEDPLGDDGGQPHDHKPDRERVHRRLPARPAGPARRPASVRVDRAPRL